MPNTLCVKSAAVAADDFDFRMMPEPIRCLFGRASFQHVCNTPTLKVDDDRSVIEAFAPAPIINRDGAQESIIATLACMTFELSKDRVVADWHREP